MASFANLQNQSPIDFTRAKYVIKYIQWRAKTKEKKERENGVDGEEEGGGKREQK